MLSTYLRQPFRPPRRNEHVGNTVDAREDQYGHLGIEQSIQKKQLTRQNKNKRDCATICFHQTVFSGEVAPLPMLRD
ncbi:hypothetical protein [Paraburkholderia terrae]